MVSRKTTAVAFIAILIIAWLVVLVTQVGAQTTDEQKQALIGEWRGRSEGYMRASVTLIIHEIDTAKTKARCTYTTALMGEKKYPVLADFTPGANPKLDFKLEMGDYQFVLKNNQLQGRFKGIIDGIYVNSTITMEKYPKK